MARQPERRNTMENLIELVPEDKREEARAAIEKELEKARNAGKSESAYKMRIELKEAKAEIDRLMAETMAEPKDVSKFRLEIEKLSKEVETLSPYKAKAMEAELRRMIFEIAPLSDDAFLDHVVKATGVSIDVGEDGSFVLANKEKLEEWAKAPENAKRLKGKETRERPEMLRVQLSNDTTKKVSPAVAHILATMPKHN